MKNFFSKLMASVNNKKHESHLSSNAYDCLQKKIYIFWDTGFDKAPPLVQLCASLWEKLNPNYTVIKLDATILPEVFNGIKVSLDFVPVQAVSDIVRVHMLSNYGGIWVDSTVLPVKPLDLWLPDVFQNEFFAFHCHHAEYCLISSWFLASCDQGYIINKWLMEMIQYWSTVKVLYRNPRDGNPLPDNGLPELFLKHNSHDDTYPYFWSHYLFTGLVLNDSNFRKIWDNIPVISSTPLHKLQHLLKINGKYNDYEVYEILSNSILEKLDWRIEVDYWEQLKQIIFDLNGIC